MEGILLMRSLKKTVLRNDFKNRLVDEPNRRTIPFRIVVAEKGVPHSQDNRVTAMELFGNCSPVGTNTRLLAMKEFPSP